MSLSILPADPSRDEWLAARRQGIAATDVPAILGISPWKSPVAVYAEKLGLVEDQTETRAMRLGRAAEPALLREYEIETGRRAVLSSSLYRHPDVNLLGTPDAFEVIDPDGIELKTSRRADGWGEPGTDDVPSHYLVQVAVYMALLERPRWYVAALIAGSDFRIYEVRRDMELEGVILEAAARFWKDNVLAQVPPDLDGSESARAIVSARYPRNLVPLRPARPDESLLVDELGAARAGLDAAEEKVNRLETCLKESIADADGIEGDGFKLTWRATKGRTTTDWKALIADAKVPSEIVLRHTTTTPGSRRFLLQLAGGSDVR